MGADCRQALAGLAGRSPREYTNYYTCALYESVLHVQPPAADAEDAVIDDEGDTDDSGWETASDSEAADAAPSSAAAAATEPAQNGHASATDNNVAPSEGEAGAGEWDVRRSLFDAHVAPSMAANLEYMWKRFGFYFPEAEHLADPEGLLKYLVRRPPLCMHRWERQVVFREWYCRLLGAS